jgi:hypothetical protein
VDKKPRNKLCGNRAGEVWDIGTIWNGIFVDMRGVIYGDKKSWDKFTPVVVSSLITLIITF